MLTKELLEQYRKQNPRKYAIKLARGEFGYLGKEPEKSLDASINPCIVKPAKTSKTAKTAKKYGKQKRTTNEVHR